MSLNSSSLSWSLHLSRSWSSRLLCKISSYRKPPRATWATRHTPQPSVYQALATAGPQGHVVTTQRRFWSTATQQLRVTGVDHHLGCLWINKYDSFQTFKLTCTMCTKMVKLEEFKIDSKTIVITSAVSAVSAVPSTSPNIPLNCYDTSISLVSPWRRVCPRGSLRAPPRLMCRCTESHRLAPRKANFVTMSGPEGDATPLRWTLVLFYNQVLHLRMIENDRFFDFMYFMWFWLLFNDWWFPSEWNAQIQVQHLARAHRCCPKMVLLEDQWTWEVPMAKDWKLNSEEESCKSSLQICGIAVS